MSAAFTFSDGVEVDNLDAGKSSLDTATIFCMIYVCAVPLLSIITTLISAKCRNAKSCRGHKLLP